MRIAVIGVGSIGLRHLRNLKTLGYAHVRGWDIDPAKGDPIDWAWKPDVVLVCTPPASHTGLVWQIPSGTKGIFVEKPLSDQLGEDEETIIRSVANLGIITMVAANWRFRSGMQDLLFRPGPLHITATIPIPQERRTNLTWDVTIHWIDLETWATREGFEHQDFQAISTYAEPYSVKIRCGDKAREWRKGNNAMYLGEMRHFMHCIKTGKPTGNDLGQAAETLKLALGVKDG